MSGAPARSLVVTAQDSKATNEEATVRRRGRAGAGSEFSMLGLLQTPAFFLQFMFSDLPITTSKQRFTGSDGNAGCRLRPAGGVTELMVFHRG